MNKTQNCFYLLLILILTVFSFFPVLKVYIGFIYFLIPLLIFVAVVVYLSTENKTIVFDRNLMVFYFYFGFWIAYSLISVLWASNKDIVPEYSLWIFSYFVIVFLVTQYVYSGFNLKRIVLILNLTLFVYLIMSVVEMTTFSHLPLSRMTLLDRISFIPTGPFYNENSFAAAIIMIFPFMLFLHKIIKSKFIIIYQTLSTLLLIAIVTIQKARLAMIAIAFNILIFFIFFTNIRTKLQLLLVVIIIISIFGAMYPEKAKLVGNYLITQTQSINTEQTQLLPSSMKIRTTLIYQSIDIAYLSYFKGVGSGNFINKMDSWRKFETYKTMDPHNYVLELLVNFGFVIMILFLAFISKLTIGLFAKLKNKKDKNYWFYVMCLLSLINFWPASLLPGSIRKLFFFWIIFAFCFALLFLPKDIKGNEFS